MGNGRSMSMSVLYLFYDDYAHFYISSPYTLKVVLDVLHNIKVPFWTVSYSNQCPMCTIRMS